MFSDTDDSNTDTDDDTSDSEESEIELVDPPTDDECSNDPSDMLAHTTVGERPMTAHRPSVVCAAMPTPHPTDCRPIESELQTTIETIAAHPSESDSDSDEENIQSHANGQSDAISQHRYCKGDYVSVFRKRTETWSPATVVDTSIVDNEEIYEVILRRGLKLEVRSSQVNVKQ